MSKKKIVALTLSLVVIFGLALAVVSTMKRSANNSSNDYATSQTQSSSAQQSAQSSDAPEKKATAKTTSSTTKATTTADSASTTAGSTKISGLHGSTKSSAATTSRSAKTTTTKATSPTTHKTTRQASHATANRNVCTVTIKGPVSEGQKTMLKSTVKVHSGDKVFNVLKRATTAKHMSLAYKGGNIYVRGIDGLFEFDKGSGSGWMYNVNGHFPDVSCGSYPAKRGDKINWLYTENLGKDIHAAGVITGGK